MLTTYIERYTRLTMSKDKRPPLRAPSLQVPEDCNRTLHAFCEKHPGMSKADVVRAALVRFLPELAEGKAMIVNGKLVYRDELAAA